MRTPASTPRWYETLRCPSVRECPLMRRSVEELIGDVGSRHDLKRGEGESLK